MALTTLQEQKLARLQHYATRYELAAIRGNERVLIVYTPRKNRQVLWASLRERAEAVCALTGASEVTFGKKAADGATMGEWRICFTGRTQREAIIEGELPFVLDLFPTKEERR
jgi:hypothetical protein